MLEPVTITSSIVIPDRSAVDGVGDVSCPNVNETESRKTPAVLNSIRPMNGRLMTPLLANGRVVERHLTNDKFHPKIFSRSASAGTPSSGLRRRGNFPRR